MLIANQSGWELRNPCAFTATWFGQENGADVMIVPDKRDADQLLPVGRFGSGILTWHLPLLFRTPPGYNLFLVRGPANYPKDGVCALEGIVETDWASASFSVSWKLTRKLIPVRFEVDEPICMIVPQRRAELEEFTPELRRIESDEDLQRKYELFRRSRDAEKQIEQVVRVTAGEQVEWQGDYTRGRHTDGEAGTPDHQTRRASSFICSATRSEAAVGLPRSGSTSRYPGGNDRLDVLFRILWRCSPRFRRPLPG